MIMPRGTMSWARIQSETRIPCCPVPWRCKMQNASPWPTLNLPTDCKAIPCWPLVA
ncbi:hypothetical protein ACRALDRAFT_208558 [Sodiomyces alcalophilus JCM 7366]|uniref:uncharacterized protein n=1 Tax=Sodiomyces alcalophilus JCM 7366 TaxID=591952 RepID=UPI0039B4A966